MKKHLKEDPSKVVFLDIDGVLNSDNFFTSKYHDRLLLSRGEIKMKSTNILQEISKIDETEVYVTFMEGNQMRLYAIQDGDTYPYIDCIIPKNTKLVDSIILLDTVDKVFRYVDREISLMVLKILVVCGQTCEFLQDEPYQLPHSHKALFLFLLAV